MASSSKSSVVADVLTCLLHIVLGLIESQDWDRLHEIALSNPAAFQLISEVVPNCKELNGMTLLHACVRYDPPGEVLARMIELHPGALEEVDCCGRTPLHVAAGSGASPSIVELLAVNHPGACDVRDEDGRTPLHFACETSCELFEDFDPPRDPPSLKTIKILLWGSLNAVTVEDGWEMNAVECALMSGASMQVINTLHRASQRVMAMRRTEMMSNKTMSNHGPTRSPHQMGAVRSRLRVQFSF